MNAVINFKTDAKIKKEAQKTAQDMGLSLSSVLNAMLRHYVRHKTLYINSQNPKELSPRVKQEIKDAEKDYEQGSYVSFDHIQDAIQHLNRFRK